MFRQENVYNARLLFNLVVLLLSFAIRRLLKFSTWPQNRVWRYAILTLPEPFFVKALIGSMFLSASNLRSKLGRKFFLLLFLVAFVPMLLFASFSYNYVGNYLYYQSQRELHNEARFYSTLLYESLQVAQAKFVNGVSDERVRQLSWQDVEPFMQHLSVAEKRALAERVRTGMVSLLSQPQGTVLLLQQLAGSAASIRVLELPIAELLGDEDMRHPRIQYCVFGSYDERLFCSHNKLLMGQQFSEVMREHGQRANFSLEWQRGDAAYVAQVRTIFIDQLFGAPGLKLWVSKSRKDIFATLGVLQKIFSMLVAVAIALAAVISALQIKRILNPFKILIAGTKAIAEKKFDVQIDVKSNDEFTELAQSFNQMADQLGKQFSLLTGLSNIDQLILNVPDLDQVAQSALHTMKVLVSSDAAAIGIRNPDKPDEIFLFSYCCERGIQPMVTQLLDEQEDHWLSAVAPVHRATLSDAQYLDWLWPEEKELLGGNTYLFPITVANKNRGVLALAWKRSYKLPEHDRSLLHDFADRLAVAITAVRREKQLYLQTHFDVLTQLPNRQLMKDRLEQSLKHASNSETAGAVLFVDLDKFQNINDTEGYGIGDQMLVKTAERLKVCVTVEDTVARQGGDEFIVILNNINSPMRATRVAEKILTMLSSPYNVDGKKYFMNCSIGIAAFPSDGMDVESLLRKADTAMHRVKQEGGGRYRYFEEEMNRAAQRRVNAERRLREALDQAKVELHYQPQWSMDDNRFSVEALVRLRNPEMGLLLPEDFIRVAEDTGLILDVGEWVIRQACQQMASWRIEQVDVSRVSVNVSAVQLARSDFVDLVQSALNDFNLEYSDLELEITESILINDAHEAVKKLGLLRDMGVAIAIDDFGTGYSSLSYLHQLPFDLIKIDQSFVSGIGTVKGSEEIIRTIIDLARSLNKNVMAEGVETREQLEALKQLECRCIQGFLISRPLTANKITEFLLQANPVEELN